MRIRKLVLIGVVALVAASCGADSQAANPQPLGLLQQGDSTSLQVLAYDFQPDTSLEYAFTLDTTMNTQMDFPDLGGSGNMSIGMGLAGEMTYDVAPGTRAGSVEITMRSRIKDFDLSHFTMDGQSVAGQLSADDLEAMSDQNALPEVTVVVAENGEILELRYGGAALPTDFLSGFGSSGFSDPTGMSFTSMFGPEMPSEGVGVGAEWVVDDSQDIPGLGTLQAQTHYWVTSEKEFNGRDVLVIVSSSTIADVEVDLMEMLAGMMTMDSASLDALGMDPAELAEAQREMLDGMEMNMGFSYDSIEATTYFDPVDGLVVWTSTDAAMTGVMEMKTPEGDGTMTFDMLMDIEMVLAS